MLDSMCDRQPLKEDTGKRLGTTVLLLLRPSSGVHTSKGFPLGTDSVDCFKHPRLQVATLKLVGQQASWDSAAFPHTSVCTWVLSARVQICETLLKVADTLKP